MNQIPYRTYHLLQLLESYSQQTRPLDFFISLYFKEHSSLGSKDRLFVADTAYALIRWQALLDYLAGDSSWQARLETYQQIDWAAIQAREDIPTPIKVSFPSDLFDLLCQNYGPQNAADLALISNDRAPTTIRVNPLKIERDALLEKWSTLYEVAPTRISALGINFHKKINFFQLPEFKAGFFEVQDEGSQLLAALIGAKSGEQVLDFCAGSGGKALAFAPQMAGKGQIYLHDIRPFALQEAKKRMRRAGIQNYQILLPGSAHMRKLKKSMDWVLVDAPCSGTGTLRRNPDMKWKFSLEILHRLLGEQRKIFEQALSFLKPSGKIVYATCSILKEENQNQLAHFLATYSLEVEGEIFQSFPTKGGMDGFFGVVLKKK